MSEVYPKSKRSSFYLEKILQVNLLVIFSLLVISDVLARKNVFMARFGTMIWFVSFFYLFSFALVCLKDILVKIIKGRSIVSLILLIFFLVLIGINLNQAKNLGGETLQEIGCALSQLEKSADWGFRGQCFLGYPTRGYLIPAIPSILFGRSLFSLHLGGSLFFILGVIIFSSGVLSLFKYEYTGDLVSGLVLSLVLHTHYLNQFLFYFEQSNFPFSLTMILVGLFMHYWASRKVTLLYLSGILLLYFIYSYTPALALFLFAEMFIFIMFFHRQIPKWHKILLVAIMVGTLISFATSFQFRGRIPFLVLEERNQRQLVEDVIEAGDHLLFQKETRPFVSHILTGFFVAFFLMSLTGFFGWHYILLSLYLMAVFLISVLSHGYDYYHVDFRLHRTMVVLPVFYAMLVFLLKKYPLEKVKKYLYFFIVLFFLAGFMTYRQYIVTKTQIRPLENITWLKNHLKLEGGMPTKKLYYASGPAKNIDPFNDLLLYFGLPLEEANVSEAISPDCEIRDKEGGIFLMPPSHRCYNQFLIFSQNSNRAIFHGIMNSLNDGELAVFEINK